MVNIMLIGLPGSGKSSAAKYYDEHMVISTDSTRAGLYGSEEIQGEWLEVWQSIKAQFECAKALGLPVLYDACNLTREYRRGILEAFPGEWVACVSNVDPWDCWKRNCRRQRVVPGEAFNNMVASFEFPTLDEGFVSIETI